MSKSSSGKRGDDPAETGFSDSLVPSSPVLLLLHIQGEQVFFWEITALNLSSPSDYEQCSAPAHPTA